MPDLSNLSDAELQQAIKSASSGAPAAPMPAAAPMPDLSRLSDAELQQAIQSQQVVQTKGLTPLPAEAPIPATKLPAAPVVTYSPAFTGSTPDAKDYVDPSGKPDPIGQAFLAMDAAGAKYQGQPSPGAKAAYQGAAQGAVNALASVPGAMALPAYQQFTGELVKNGFAALPQTAAATPSLLSRIEGIPGKIAGAFEDAFSDKNLLDPVNNRGIPIGQMFSGAGHFLQGLGSDLTPLIPDHFGGIGDSGTDAQAQDKFGDLVGKAVQLDPATAGPAYTVSVAGGYEQSAQPQITQAFRQYSAGNVAGAKQTLSQVPGTLGDYARAHAWDTAFALLPVVHAGLGPALGAAKSAVQDARIGRLGAAGATAAPFQDAAYGQSSAAVDPPTPGYRLRPAPVPAEVNTAAPGNNNPAPGNNNPAPGNNNPAPGNNNPAPGNNNPAPGYTMRPVQPSPSAGQSAGNINLGRIDTTPDAAAGMKVMLPGIPGSPTTQGAIRSAARALNLTPEHLAGITPGTVPGNVTQPVFTTAVRELHVAQAEKSAAADAAYKADPSPANLAALTEAAQSQKVAATHASALAQVAGQTLGAHNIQASAFEGALAAAAEKAQALHGVPPLADALPSPAMSVKTVRPKSAGYGTRNTVVTTDAYQAALKDLAKAGSRVNSGIDPALLKTAVTIGAYHLEAGLRQFGPWAAEMRTHFPQATDSDLQRVYAGARSDVSQSVTQQQRRALSPALSDRLTPRMGRQGAANFVNALPPAVLDKLLSGAKMTDAESRTLAEAHNANLLPKQPAAQPSAVLKTLSTAVRDAKAGRLGYDSAKAAVREELLKAVPPEKVRAVATALAKVGDDDFHGLANVYNKFHPASAVDKVRTVQQASLLSGPKTIGAIALAHTLGAGFEDLAVRPVAAALSGGTVQGLNFPATGAAIKAGARALPDGMQMLREGPTAMQLRGISPAYRMQDISGGHLHGEPIQSPIIRAPGRVHAALYHVIGQSLTERGLQEASALKARQIGGSPSQYRGDPDVVQKAQQYTQEQLFQNKNAGASAITKATQGHQTAQAVVNTLVPFRSVPLNLAGRGLEYSGAGLPVAAARALRARAQGKELFSGNPIVPKGASAAESAAAQEGFRRSLAFQAARGIAGPAAGLTAGYGLAASGVLNPPNEKSFENGSLNIGRVKVDIGRLQPVSTPVLEGGELYNRLHGRPASALAPFADNPYLNVAQQMQNVRDGSSGNPRALQQAAGSILGELSPTILSQIAAATDPSGDIRKKNTAWDYLLNRVPGLRERLMTTGHPQPGNIRSVGLLGALAPVNVSPRTRR